MKTAVWMTGGMRSHWKERCLKSFKEKILDVLDCDLYISTAKTQGGDEETIKEIYPDAKLNYITEVDEIPGGPNIPIQTNDDIVQCSELCVPESCVHQFILVQLRKLPFVQLVLFIVLSSIPATVLIGK